MAVRRMNKRVKARLEADDVDEPPVIFNLSALNSGLEAKKPPNKEEQSRGEGVGKVKKPVPKKVKRKTKKQEFLEKLEANQAIKNKAARRQALTKRLLRKKEEEEKKHDKKKLSQQPTDPFLLALQDLQNVR